MQSTPLTQMKRYCLLMFNKLKIPRWGNSLKVRFENNEIYVIKLLKMIEINDVEKIKRALKSKRFSLMINFDYDSKIDYLKMRMKST